MNAYLEPAYRVLMNAIASPDLTIGPWLQESSFTYKLGMPVALSLTAAGAVPMGTKLLKVNTQRQRTLKAKTAETYATAVTEKPKGGNDFCVPALQLAVLLQTKRLSGEVQALVGRAHTGVDDNASSISRNAARKQGLAHAVEGVSGVPARLRGGAYQRCATALM